MNLLPEDCLLYELQVMARTQAQKGLAAKLNISEQYLCDILKGRRAISDVVARSLGYRRVSMFERVEEAAP